MNWLQRLLNCRMTGNDPAEITLGYLGARYYVADEDASLTREYSPHVAAAVLYVEAMSSSTRPPHLLVPFTYASALLS